MEDTIKTEFKTLKHSSGNDIVYSNRELLTEEEVIYMLNISKERLRELWENREIGQELFFLRKNKERLYLSIDIECFMEWHINARKKIK